MEVYSETHLIELEKSVDKLNCQLILLAYGKMLIQEARCTNHAEPNGKSV